MPDADKTAISQVHAFRVTRTFQALLRLGLALTPFVAIAYLQLFQDPALTFRNHGVHELAIAVSTLLSALIFRTRAAALLAGKGADWCSGYLSGLLVGAEIGGHRDWLTGPSVPLIGSARFARLYGAALARIGVEGVAVDAAEATIAGLKEARAQ